MTRDEMYMSRCLQLAALGLGKVQPNPMVGAVIVHQDQIIGEGWHRQYGQAHAEVNAFASVKQPELLKESTMYVSLEPCSHFGKTPPCADAIIRHGVPKVVIGTVDSNAKVNGGGIRKLQDAGIEVVTGVLADQCKELNRRFFTYHEQKRPYVILKWAMTRNGYMDIDRQQQPDGQYWITNPELKTLVHQWRSEEDAILIGYNTMINDKPQLTTRLFPGKNPQRFVCQRNSDSSENSYYQTLPENPAEALQQLYELKIQSVIVEGGRKTLQRFIDSQLWDEARILVGDQLWESGVKAPLIDGICVKEENIHDNIIRYVRRHV
ncbi:MAG: bifunctional diaminohydroxyphosphoribosylaminopyrimidine deaminase/5-amino-6-(5-phosphoribosylamino)uracil reductase RibD [Bacteroidales bacterium]|nr:bifunctional diaminohydroxyphosphoribosylaminopyrimidine deaminase/5-amino-6-(5-phosphoribosylamino)uracil reductase RibD [Bacteroidales bacterium]